MPAFQLHPRVRRQAGALQVFPDVLVDALLGDAVFRGCLLIGQLVGEYAPSISVLSLGVQNISILLESILRYGGIRCSRLLPP